MRISSAVVASMLGLVSLTPAASAGTALTREDVLKEIAQKLPNCRALRVGRVHIKPVSQPSVAKEIATLQKIGVITVRNADAGTANPSNIPSPQPGKEAGEGDLEIAISPAADQTQIGTLSGTTPCLKTGREAVNFQIVSFDFSEKKGIDLAVKKLLLALGTFDNLGEPTPYSQAFLNEMGVKPLGKKVKFRTLYEYDASRDRWAFRAIDLGDATEDSFRSDMVERVLAR